MLCGQRRAACAKAAFGLKTFHKGCALFLKWPKIPILEDRAYCVTEKLDGSNLCVSLDLAGGIVQFYTREGKNAEGALLYLKKNRKIFTPLLNAACGFDFEADFQTRYPQAGIFYKPCGILFYGEYLNRFNMNRIPYTQGRESAFKVFGIKLVFQEAAGVRYQILGFGEVIRLLALWGVKEEYLVPVIEESVLLSELLKRSFFPLKSRLYEGYAEGIVCHPMEAGGAIYKLKSDEFLEVLRAQGGAFKSEGSDDAVSETYSSFLTKGRAYAVQSKIGIICEKNLQRAVSELIKDSLEDFTCEHPEFAGFKDTGAFFKCNARAFQLMKSLCDENAETVEAGPFEQ